MGVMSAALTPSRSAQNLPDTYFHTSSPIWVGRTFMEVHALVLRGVALRSEYVTCTSGLSAPLVIVEHLCRGMFFFQEHHLCVKKETTFFWKVARGPLDCADTENSKHSPPLPSKGKGDNCISRGPKSAHGRQFDARKRRWPCLGTALFSWLIVPLYI